MKAKYAILSEAAQALANVARAASEADAIDDDIKDSVRRTFLTLKQAGSFLARKRA